MLPLERVTGAFEVRRQKTTTTVMPMRRKISQWVIGQS